jgi:uncharacterized RDD family membrane protein YckC
MTYVGVGRRFVAIFVDSIVLLILSGPFAEIRRGDGYLQVDWTGWRIFWPSLIVIFYFVLLEGIAGATIGKFLTGIRVVNQDGTKLTWSASIVRNIARIVDAFPYVVPYLVAAISVWASPIQQRLGDRWANTVVVTKESLRAFVPGAPGSTADGGWQHVPTSPTAGAPSASADAAARRLTAYHCVSVAPSASLPVHPPSATRYSVSAPATCFR